MAFDWKQALAGATGGGISGAGTGATLGGPWGALIGALLGLGSGGLAGGFGGGKEGGIQNVPTTGPEQNNILDMLMKMGSQNLQNPYEGFEPIRNAATSHFFQNIVPGLQEQFTGAGGRGSNSYSSPLIQSQLSSAGAGLSERLAALQSQYGQNNKNNAIDQLKLGLTPRFQSYYQNRQPGFGENLLSGSIKAAPAMAQGYQQNQLLEKLIAANGG